MDAGGQGLLNPVYTKASVIHIIVYSYEYVMVLNARMEKQARSQSADRPSTWLSREIKMIYQTQSSGLFCLQMSFKCLTLGFMNQPFKTQQSGIN